MPGSRNRIDVLLVNPGSRTAVYQELGDRYSAIDLAVAHYAGGKSPFRVVADYTADNVSQKVVRIILSYTDYVNRTVWRKV